MRISNLYVRKDSNILIYRSYQILIPAPASTSDTWSSQVHVLPGSDTNTGSTCTRATESHRTRILDLRVRVRQKVIGAHMSASDY